MATDTCIYSNADCPRCAPSRAFMIQQAVLNFMACGCPFGLKSRGPSGQLRHLLNDLALATNEGGYLHGAILHEYRSLASQYEVRAA